MFDTRQMVAFHLDVSGASCFVKKKKKGGGGGGISSPFNPFHQTSIFKHSFELHIF